MFHVIRQAIAIWMMMEAGAMSPSMATCGIRLKLPRTGHLTAMGLGIGLARGAGRGLTIHRGALRRSTTAAGRSSAAGGVGALGQFLVPRFMGPPSWVFSAAASD